MKPYDFMIPPELPWIGKEGEEFVKALYAKGWFTREVLQTMWQAHRADLAALRLTTGAVYDADTDHGREEVWPECLDTNRQLETRKALDERQYPYSDFVKYYGQELGDKFWERAKEVTSPEMVAFNHEYPDHIPSLVVGPYRIHRTHVPNSPRLRGRGEWLPRDPIPQGFRRDGEQKSMSEEFPEITATYHLQWLLAQTELKKANYTRISNELEARHGFFEADVTTFPAGEDGDDEPADTLMRYHIVNWITNAQAWTNELEIVQLSPGRLAMLENLINDVAPYLMSSRGLKCNTGDSVCLKVPDRPSMNNKMGILKRYMPAEAAWQVQLYIVNSEPVVLREDEFDVMPRRANERVTAQFLRKTMQMVTPDELILELLKHYINYTPAIMNEMTIEYKMEYIRDVVDKMLRWIPWWKKEPDALDGNLPTNHFLRLSANDDHRRTDFRRRLYEHSIPPDQRTLGRLADLQYMSKGRGNVLNL